MARIEHRQTGNDIGVSIKVLITDHDRKPNLKRNLLTLSGIETVAGQCRSAEEVIALGRETSTIIAPEAPMHQHCTEAVRQIEKDVPEIFPDKGE